MTVTPREHDDSFLEWLARHGGRLYKAAYGLCGDQAEDMVADALVKLYKAWGDPTTRAKIESNIGYAIRVIQNVIRDHFRSPTRSKRFERAFELERDDRGALAEYRNHEVRKAVKDLPERERQAIFWTYWMDMSTDEVANIMDLSTSSVSRLRQDAIRKLRGLLTETDVEGTE